VYRPLTPLLILVGEKDDWTPAEPCRKLTEARVNPSVATGRGATTGGDPAAWADSIREVTAFFARYLK
jgi:dienelactone hydrolase